MSDPQWPLPPHEHELLTDLARIVALGGAWRLVRGPVAAATTRDYPEAWDQSRAALGRVIGRSLWHAHLAGVVALEDARRPAAPDRHRLRTTMVELVHADTARLELVVTSIGNDDVAGIVAHEIGRAYIAGIASSEHPFRRTEADLPDAAIGSVATVAIGLGVVAANAAHHDRSAGEVVGRMSYHEHQIAHAGGLDWQDLAFLLAVQTTVRDDAIAAFDSLRPSQAEAVAAWCDVLDDHEAELVALLGLAGVDAETAPSRPDAPPHVVVRGGVDEADLDRPNVGQRVFRYPERRTFGLGLLGFLAGTAGTIVATLAVTSFYEPGTAPLAFLFAMLAPVVLGTIGGGIYGATKRLYRCATCGSIVTATATGCRSCGGTIAGEIRSRNERLDREEELETAEARGADEG